MVDPSMFPVYLRLGCSKPQIAEDCLLFSKLRKIELKVGVVGPCLNLKIGVEVELSTFVFRSIDIQ